MYALTGVIGSGKSTTSKIFASLGAVILDADKLARKVLSPEYDRFSQVVQLLKEKLEPEAKKRMAKSIFSRNLKDDIQIDRSALADLVFNSKENLEKLNRIVHPEVQRLLKEMLSQIRTDRVVIYDIPLLYENDLQKTFKETILVFAPEELCIARTSRRTGLPEDKIEQRMKTQISIEEKRKLADHIIDNSGGMDQLKMEVARVWRLLLQKNS